MEIRDKKEGDIVILEPIRRIDTNTSSEFENKIVEVMDSGVTRFVVDLKEIDYISSAGLRVFLMAIKKLKSPGGSFIICSMSDHIKEVFDISGFTPIFTITADQASGLTAAWTIWIYLMSDQPSREVRNLNALLDVAKALGAEMQLDNLLPVIISKNTEVIDAERSSLFIYDEDTNEM